MEPSEVVAFWREAGPSKWFGGGPAFDEAIRERFEAAHHAAARNEMEGWAETLEGVLALLLLLDQFPRNLYRNSPHAFATDPLARRIARMAAERGFHLQAEDAMRPFFVLPFEHSESLDDQDLGASLAHTIDGRDGGAQTLKWVEKHREVIRRFGRFPHRNRALGRESTPEEQAYVDGGGGFG